MRVAIDDLQVGQAPISEQVGPRGTAIFTPDAVKRHAVIDLRVPPQPPARLPATAGLQSSQQGGLLAWRIPELPSNDAGAVPARTLVWAFAPQVGMPTELIDRLSARS